MPTPWFRRVRREGQLTVLNNAGTWSTAVTKAIATFNGLGFPVRLVATDDDRNALIKVKLSTGPDKQSSWGHEVKTKADFDSKLLHGQTITVTEIHEGRTKVIELVFAGIFLPGRAEATAGQREVIIVHEFIHAIGLDGGLPDGSKSDTQDHDTEGIMYDIMVTSGNGLLEGSRPNGVSAMPPIRVGGKTQCKIQSIWGTEGCRE